MTNAAKGSILKLMGSVLGAQFAGASWDGWRVILKAMFALPFEDGELETFEKLTAARPRPQKRPVRYGPYAGAVPASQLCPRWWPCT